MKDGFTILELCEADCPAIERLYPLAFPGEDLLPLVRQLLVDEAVTHFVCKQGEAIVGHVAFTSCTVSGNPEKAMLLGPLAVHPDHQRSGIGSALVTSGIDAMKEAGASVALVLGDPAYYGRFGFAAEREIEPPYRLPAEWSGAWQSIRVADAATRLVGKLEVPEPWQPEALWLP